MDELTEVQEAFEQHMLRFTLEYGLGEYEDIVNFIKNSGYTHDAVIAIYNKLVDGPYAEAHDDGKKGYLRLTPKGKGVFASKYSGRPPGTFHE